MARGRKAATRKRKPEVKVLKITTPKAMSAPKVPRARLKHLNTAARSQTIFANAFSLCWQVESIRCLLCIWRLYSNHFQTRSPELERKPRPAFTGRSLSGAAGSPLFPIC